MLHAKFKNLDKIINRVENLNRLWEDKVARFLEELAKIGIDSMDVSFKNAQYDGTNDVAVDQEPHWVSDNKLYITARGKSITFIEFGSGVFYYEDEHPKALELGFIRGEFGYKQGSHPPWTYEGEPGSKGRVLPNGRILTYGNPAAMALPKAVQDMRDNIQQIAKEIFYDRH